jgi:hypothetical protein
MQVRRAMSTSHSFDLSGSFLVRKICGGGVGMIRFLKKEAGK